ncbi:hypothetical protein BGZ61DRAFT_181279 [Ilyonectria robusta]|uniref:uncharacterized protein n=1 Tax=Ilyonectria robusta TaxID=1079257 RepID=UPI001E8CEA7C|nr:uncharacterized protein BGZ61DRAFT_181279 [Ilyonectria robusta]KAH8729400.1 hypothetical protein BGZ61DRAFT_181279 [Ilyonectria robusta]
MFVFIFVLFAIISSQYVLPQPPCTAGFPFARCPFCPAVLPEFHSTYPPIKVCLPCKVPCKRYGPACRHLSAYHSRALPKKGNTQTSSPCTSLRAA